MAGRRYDPVAGHEQIGSLTSVKSLTLPALGENVAYVSVEAASVRWRDDGTDPTIAVGHLVRPGSDFWYEGDLSKIKFISDSADAKVDVSYYAGTVR